MKNKLPSRLATLFSILVWLAPGCRTAPPPAGSVNMQLGNKEFVLEVVDTDATRSQGLMHRKSMPDDHGMIFVFRHDQLLSFWMKNTLIPLDIIYINSASLVVAVKQMQPLNESGVSSDLPAKWAIELNQGMAAKAGIKVGDRVEIPSAAREARE